MLVLSRRTDQEVVFPNVGITLKVLKVRGQVVKLGIEAPADIEVLRPEAKGRPGKPSKTPLHLNRHDLKGRVHNLRLALAVFDRQQELGLLDESEQTFQRLMRLLSELDEQLSVGSVAEPVASAPETAGRSRLLVVEDDANERELLAGLLRLYGYDVTVAANGAEALALLDRGQTPELVLLDVNMPQINGLEVVERIRNDGRFNDLPVYAVSGADPAMYRTGGELSRFNGWFPKPVDPARLLSAINASQHVQSTL